MEITTEYLDVKIDGEEHVLSLMTYESAEEALKKLGDLKETDASAALQAKGKVLADCGLPVDILKKLQIKHVNQLFEGVIGAEKD